MAWFLDSDNPARCRVISRSAPDKGLQDFTLIQKRSIITTGIIIEGIYKLWKLKQPIFLHVC